MIQLLHVQLYSTCSKEPDFWRLAPNYAAGTGEGAAIAGELDIVTFKLLFGGGGGGGLAKAPEPNDPWIQSTKAKVVKMSALNI
jgi:hypothetical protein